MNNKPIKVGQLHTFLSLLALSENILIEYLENPHY